MTDNRLNNSRNKEMSLIGLFSKDYLAGVQNNLISATGISFFMIDYRGTPVTDHDFSNLFCTSRANQEEYYNACQMAYAMAAAKSAIQNIPYVFYGPDHLANIAIPVIVKNQYLGALIGGPAICSDDESGDAFESVAVASSLPEYDVSVLPVFTMQRLKALADLVYRLFSEIGEKETCLLDTARMEHDRVHYDALRKKNLELTNKIKELELQNLRIEMPNQLVLNLFTAVSNFAILENAEKTENLVSEFSSVLRFYLDEYKDKMEISQALEQVRSYLNVLKMQFDDNFDFRINCQPVMETQMIPALSLLPFVTYMIDSFVSSKNGRGKFYIDVEKYGPHCRISMQMDGAQSGKSGGLGSVTDIQSIQKQISLIRKRFEYEYHENCMIDVHAARTILEIPIESKGH